MSKQGGMLMAVKVNGKEVSREEFCDLIERRLMQRRYIREKSKTYLGREELRRKGITPIYDDKK
jgi:hypothetical protein